MRGATSSTAPSSETQEQLVGAGKSLKRASKKFARRKVKGESGWKSRRGSKRGSGRGSRKGFRIEGSPEGDPEEVQMGFQLGSRLRGVHVLYQPESPF